MKNGKDGNYSAKQDVCISIRIHVKTNHGKGREFAVLISSGESYYNRHYNASIYNKNTK